MRLATLRDGSRDGTLVVVRQDAERYAIAEGIAGSLQAALDEWDIKKPQLEMLALELDSGDERGLPLDLATLTAPLPRAYEWIDGSAYVNHIVLVRKARGAEPPETLWTDPLVYQGGSGVLLGPHDDIPLIDEAFGLDLEAEVCVVLGDTPQGTTRERAADCVKLLVLCNDLTYRNLVPAELQKGFGFFQSKPASAFSPFAVTPDEIGAAWRDGRMHLRVRSLLNGVLLGDPEAGAEMHFSFFDLIGHICKTRSFTAGTLLGSGTVSNRDPDRGVSCLAERRVRETLDSGEARTSFLKAGDHIAIEVLGEDGRTLFGTISQRVVMK